MAHTVIVEGRWSGVSIRAGRGRGVLVDGRPVTDQIAGYTVSRTEITVKQVLLGFLCGPYLRHRLDGASFRTRVAQITWDHDEVSVAEIHSERLHENLEDLAWRAAYVQRQNARTGRGMADPAPTLKAGKGPTLSRPEGGELLAPSGRDAILEGRWRGASIRVGRGKSVLVDGRPVTDQIARYTVKRKALLHSRDGDDVLGYLCDAFQRLRVSSFTTVAEITWSDGDVSLAEIYSDRLHGILEDLSFQAFIRRRKARTGTGLPGPGTPQT